MFKLESYITPLLLNYVDKYIKNLKPEDSQFSLWGGDAVFCNLDLRLDVLEQELQLPFTFINGHIHELRIHIPWTKLGSEPVVITINTIECILKLCTDSDATAKKPAVRNLKKLDVVEAPPGYVQSLINRVISNICIICNNVILKYVEEDIVLSLNIKSVELFNANDKWEKAFVDTNIADTIFRKVIYMQDLTVCLDKRDASGKIETYQDPLLYRCSSTWRMYSTYNTPHSKYPALTRIHMYCESLDFSLTDQQLPMFLKLMYLCIALHNRSDVTGQCSSAKEPEGDTETKPSVADEEAEETEMMSQDASWGSWAWSFVPEVGVIWGSSGSEEEQEQEANMLKSKKIFQFGVYIGKSTCVLKQTTFSTDTSFCVSPKCVFVPLMIIKMYGCSMEFTSKGKDFLNMQSGICGVTVAGLQDCVCGYHDCSDDTNSMRNVFLKSGVPPGSGHAYSFLTSSLFDPLAPENCNQERKYCFNWTDHFATLTEEVMVKRYPAFAFDYLYQLDIPEDWIDRISSVTSSFVEDSNWHESSTYRLVFGPLCVDITSSLVHRLKKLMFSAQDYDYPYYAPSTKTSTHPANINEEILEEMEEFVPLRQYHLTLFKPVLRLSVADHYPYHSPKHDHRRGKKKRPKSLKFLKSKTFESLFCLEAYADCVDFQTSTPMYPNRLVKVIGSLSNPSQFLLHHCFDSNSVKIFGLELSLHKDSSILSPDSTIVQQTCLTFFKKCLVLPESWSSSKDFTLQESTFECSSLDLKLSEIDCLALINIYRSWTAKYFNPNGLEKLKVALSESNMGSPVINTEICGTNFLYLVKKDSTSVKFSVSSASLKFQHEGNSSVLFHSPVPTTHLHNGIQLDKIELANESDCKQNFFELLLQLPKDVNNKNPVLLVIHVEGSTACLEPALFTWMSTAFFTNINLDSTELEYASPSPVDMEGTSTSSSVTQEASVSHSFTKSHSTIIIDEKKKSLHENIEEFLRKHWEMLSFLILEVEIGSLCGICPKQSWSIVPKANESVLCSWQQAVSNGSLNEACVLCLPTVKIRNNSSVSNFLQTIDIMEIPIPIKTLQSEKKCEAYFPWTLQMNSGSIYTVYKNDKLSYKFLLWPTTVSATLALSLKENQNQLALCIHMDNKSLNLHFSAFQANLLVNCFCNVSSIFTFIERLKLWILYSQLKFNDSLDYVGSADFNVQEQVLDQSKGHEVLSQNKKTSHSEPAADLTDDQQTSKKLTLWIQLTLSKLCVVIFGKVTPNVEYENVKVQLDAEEIVSSLDIQDVYSKVKVKLSSLNINCFLKQSGILDWQPAPYEGKVLFCNNMMSKSLKSKTTGNGNMGPHTHIKPDNQPFLVFIYTQALHSNVKEKLSTDQKQRSKIPVDGLKYISEIDLKMKSFGTILWMSIFDVLHQVSRPFLAISSQNFSCVIQEGKQLNGARFCAKNLPLFYIETNIIQVYLPENTALTEVFSKEDFENVLDDRTVLLMQLDCVTLTSQVENPLPRIILDTDIYNNALNSKTIGLPGAAVEDRQYQMDIYGLSLGAISGTNILGQHELKKDFISHYPLTMGENPALEWNIGVIPENRSSEKDSILTTPIISPLNIRIAIAPAIVCDSSTKSFETEKIVVAGISSEVSITSEVCLYLSIHEVCSLNSLLKSNLNILQDIFSASPEVQQAEVSSPLHKNSFYESNVSLVPKFAPDSSLQVNLSMLDDTSNCEWIPFEMLLTAGTVSIMLFYHDNHLKPIKESLKFSKSLEKIPVLHDNSWKSPNFNSEQPKYLNLVSGNDSEKPSSKSVMLHPFLCLSIIQPHSYLLCHPSSQKFESSCFDLQLHGASVEHVLKKPNKSCTPIKDDFNLAYLETKPGEPHHKTGIPPAFFTVTCTDIFSEPANIKVSVERPMKLNIQTEIGDAVLAFLESFRQEYLQHKSPLNETLSELEEESSSGMKVLTYFKTMALSTSQIVFQFTPLMNDQTEKLILSASGIKIETDIETCNELFKGLDMNINVSSFLIQTRDSNQVWNFLQPLTLSAKIKCHFIPCFQVELGILGESLLLNISLTHILHLKKIMQVIYMQVQKNIIGIKNIAQSFNKVCQSIDLQPSTKESKKRKYWSDDLRKGSFQFLQVTESSDCEPKPHEILFGRASTNQPASMTWRYPEPRAVTKIEVSPVPFQNSDKEENKNVITCYLQYWNSSQHEYLNLCDFVLSETKHFSFDLPDLNSDSVAVSDKWRVLLDCGSYLNSDGFVEKDNHELSPLALAACMSIDSCFDPKLVPGFQFNISFELVKFILYNSFGIPGCTPNLFPFEFDDESPLSQEFALLSFLNPASSFIKKSSRVKGELSSGLNCEILEYRNLTMLPVISPVDINAKATVNFDKENVPVFDIDLVLHPCFVRLSQSIFHTLTYTIHSISQEIFRPTTVSECCEYVLPNYYIICNNLEERIRFGQAGTEESIILSPLKMHAYSWWCQKTKQVLWISIGSLGWTWSEEINIDTEGEQTVTLDHNIVALIKIKQLSNLQKQIVIYGQLIVHSQLSFPIQLRCEFPAIAPMKKNDENLLFIKSLAPQTSSPSFLVSAEQCKNMRISATGILDSQSWSESISFGDNKLLKIPSKESNLYQSVWCQVEEKKILNITSVVVFISPLFVLRSNLPLPLKVKITSEDPEEVYSLDLKGRGQEVKLFKGSDAESYLLLSFKSTTDIDMSIPALSVSLTDRNQIKMKDFDYSKDLFDVCKTMQSVQNKLWPYSFLDKPPKPGNFLHPCSVENYAVFPAVPSNNVCCKLKIERSQRWIGLNTVLYDIKPHVIVVNRLRADLYLFDKNGLEWRLPPNSVAMPSHPYDSFRLGILEDAEYFYSSGLTVDENCATKGSVVREDSEAAFFYSDSIVRIPQNGSINAFIKVQTDAQKVFLFKLHSEVQEDMIVISAFPLVTLSNESNKDFHFSLSCMPSNAQNVTYPDNCPSPVIHTNSTKECQPLLFWEASSFDVTSLTNSTSLNFYVSICFPSYNVWSYPVCIHSSASTESKNDNRHSISVPVKYGDKSPSTVPLVMTSHWRNGVLFLLLNIDPCPLLLLNNRTNVDLHYGQSCMDIEGKTEGKYIFEELQTHTTIPVLLPECSAHYSFPSLQSQFPIVPKKFPMLCLGLKEEGSQDPVWSSPFRVNIDKQFVHILGICDFMICCERTGHTINLYVDPVNRIEVNANEVRSRIALATDTKSSNEKKSSLTSKPQGGKKSSDSKIKNKSIAVARQSKTLNPPVVVGSIYFANLRVIHISFILCDEFQFVNKSTEVLRLNIDNIILFSRPQNENLSRLQDVSLCFQNIQLDNQIDNDSIVYDFPVILNRHDNSKKQSPSEKDSDIYLPNKIRENSMFILNAIVELPNEGNRILIVQSLSVDLLPVSLHVEDVFCYKVSDLLKTYVPFTFHQHEVEWMDIYVPKDVKYISDAFMQPVHFQNFKLNVQEISLSLHASLKLYLSLEHSLLRFQPFEREDILTSHYEIGRMLVVHYFTGALFRAGWVVGSLDLLGNPAGFARAVGAGMSDLVYLPYKGMLHGPRAFISGLTTGAISLFTQVSSGALTCMASLTSSISKNMDFLCLDNEHLARQELVRQHLPQGISEGLSQGLSVFGLSILGAVAGIVDHPLQALVSPSTPMQTVSGIVGGFGKGIVGVFTKPIGGAAELLSQAGYGLLHGAGWLVPPKRQYQPVTMSLRMTSCSLIKYLCKVALCQSLGQVLLALEATYVNESGEYEKNILLLTSEALCILGEDEVTLQRTFALTEIQCKKAESDRSTLVVIPSSTFHKQVFLESSDVLDRVADYVKKNRESSTASDGSPFTQDNMPESLIKSSSTYHIYFLYPKDRSLFVTLFDYAKSKALRKGF